MKTDSLSVLIVFSFPYYLIVVKRSSNKVVVYLSLIAFSNSTALLSESIAPNRWRFSTYVKSICHMRLLGNGFRILVFEGFCNPIDFIVMLFNQRIDAAF